jgi:hypothetical protein
MAMCSTPGPASGFSPIPYPFAEQGERSRFGYNSLFNNITQQLANSRDVNAELGTPFKVTDKNSWGIPNVG